MPWKHRTPKFVDKNKYQTSHIFGENCYSLGKIKFQIELQKILLAEYFVEGWRDIIFNSSLLLINITELTKIRELTFTYAIVEIFQMKNRVWIILNIFYMIKWICVIRTIYKTGIKSNNSLFGHMFGHIFIEKYLIITKNSAHLIHCYSVCIISNRPGKNQLFIKAIF